MSNDCLDIEVPRDQWEDLSQKDQNWMIYNKLLDLDKRVSALEGRKLFNEKMLTFGSFGGGIIGGLLAAFGVKIS